MLFIMGVIIDIIIIIIIIGSMTVDIISPMPPNESVVWVGATEPG
jgi:hypothetical protein